MFILVVFCGDPMIMKNAKTVLFASLIAAMILPFSGMQFAEAEEVYDGTKVKEAFIQLDPYMTVTDEKKILFDIKSANENGLDEKIIKIGKEYAKLQNDMIDSLKSGDTTNLILDEKQVTKFEKFFKKIKNGDDTLFTQSTISAVYAANCNVWGPHAQPDAVHETSTFTPITTYLIYKGYHQVQIPYSGDPSIDYAKKTTAYGCENGVFREQAIIRSSVTYDTYNPEPNSEVFDYIWPSWWWGPYVLA